jgi:hypothetical protein
MQENRTITQVLSETNEQDFEREDYTAMDAEDKFQLTIITVKEDKVASKSCVQRVRSHA